MEIRGERAMLRTPAIADLTYLRKLWADPATMKDIGGPFEISDEKAQRWFAAMIDPGSERDRFFLICDKKSGEAVGEASFHRYDPAERSAELNIKVEGRRRFGGHGFEALVLLLDFYFNDFGGAAMVDPIAPANVSGQRAMARFGFARAGATEEAVIFKLERERFNQLYAKGHP